jgi:exopolysaccharide biosynthesis polyprenyl glycosylphosphotransferase
MWWRAPWLQQRWTLLILALVDAALLLGNYNILFWWRFDRWAGATGSIVAVTALWLGSSYLLGRYSQPEEERKNNFIRRLAATLGTTAVVLFGVVVILSWGLKANDPRAFRSFVIPVLTATMLGSTATQEIANRRPKEIIRWHLVCTQAEIEVIRKELRAIPTAPLGEPELIEDLKQLQCAITIAKSRSGFAISEQTSPPEHVIEKLLTKKSQGVSICGLATWCESTLQRIPPELFSTRWLAQAEGFDLQPGRISWRLKRLGDLALGATLLAISTPLLIIAAIAIKIDDRGPVFYSQIRTGLYGEPYRVWKLRSMTIDAETGGPRWAEKSDKRITRVGKWLRQLRIDELPQLISVIKGEMSLIGPRPERPDIEEVIEKQIPHYRVRHWIRPGLSGWAQVCYPYGASVEDSRIKLSYDLYYLRNASIALDFLILIKTIRLIARCKGAIPRQA